MTSMFMLVAAMGVAVPFAVADLSASMVVGGTTVITPASTSVVGGTTIVTPGATTAIPETTVVTPDSTTIFPGSTLVLPASTTIFPGTTIVIPGTTTVVGGTTIPTPANIVPSSNGPINAPPVINDAKAGQTVPVQFRLTDANGVPIADARAFGSITSVGTTCSIGDPVNTIETYSTNTGLQYHGNGDWQFNWQTPKSYAGQCRTMQISLSNGQIGPPTLFQFR